MALIFLSVRRRYKILAAVLIGVGVLCLVLTLSRGGWIGFVLASTTVVVLAVRRGRLKAVKAVLLVGGVLLLLAALVTTSRI